MQGRFALFSAMCVALCILWAPASQAFAEPRIFQASLTPEAALREREVTIEGLTVGIWSENPQRGLALGFVSGSTGKSSGFSWSFVMNYAQSYSGVHWAPVNYTRENFSGWQNGAVNLTQQGFKGFQLGLVNYASQMRGLQLGLVNYAEEVDAGVQLGLANVIRENEWFPGMVLVNWRF